MSIVVVGGLGQVFMSEHECDNLRVDVDKGWERGLRRPLAMALASAVCFAVLAAVSVSMRIVFPGKSGGRPFCRARRRQALVALPLVEAGVHRYGGAFYLTDDEAADYYWMVVFVPSAILFFASGAYLLAGGIRCLSILNAAFALVFALLSLFLGSTLLVSGNSCSTILFWCYEISLWGLVVLYGGTAFLLRWKASMMLHQTDFPARNVELQESRHQLTADVGKDMKGDFRT